LVKRQDLTDKLMVARALMVGRRHAMEETGANAPAGKPYILAFNKWLAQHPKLAVVKADDRAAALWAIEADNWPRVQAALAALDDKERQKISLRALRARFEREAMLNRNGDLSRHEAKVQRSDFASHGPSITPDAIAAAVEKATAKLRRDHAAEIAKLKAEIERLNREVVTRMLGEFAKGEQHGMRVAAIEVRRMTAKMERSLHEAVVAKIADKLFTSGQMKPTEQDVTNAALGWGPKADRVKLPVVTEKEINPASHRAPS
jgi:hypothetical protein